MFNILRPNTRECSGTNIYKGEHSYIKTVKWVEFCANTEKYIEKALEIQETDMGFQLFRDTFIFTNKRLILIDVQGVTGSKVEYKSMPYKSITRFSLETAGTFELDAALKIWFSSEATPSVNKKFNKSIDIYEVQRYLAGRAI
ncbi:PH domain-containing protein [Algoriphagus alkaliphilus]|nr:PH domain-containing protein [Algoriphagus alkaliphilus]MBA4299087.1 PH domain-containing protein [Cyclobacterium sp.]